MSLFLFIILSSLSVGGVLGFILSRNQAHSALFLVLSFASLGGLFGLLDAPFIAAVQIIIYAGAIMVLFIFVIMMINLEQGISAEKKRWTIGLSVVVGLFLLIELALAVRNTLGGLSAPGGESIGSPVELGRLLFSDYLYPFEITSVLIVAALVGAIVLVKKKKEER